ncbi:MAG: aspartate dehydrogenase [Gammaproteobacteria bacterium]|jgi:aspartate dehydrogenase|nr:aspartate dehydrogenase [Gammaproteobacteria bacterium]
MRIGLIGLGGMGKVVVSSLMGNKSISACEVIGAIVAPEHLSQTRDENQFDLPVLDDLQALLALKPDVVAECAGHSAVLQYGEQILRAGIDLLVISIGVLADEQVYERLHAAAIDGKATMFLPAGAVGGIDALSAARLAGLNSVTYKARKPAMAWSGTAAEEKLNLAELEDAECFYKGSAREAALLYPKNSNVAATVALAGLGFDNTSVELIADPEATENIHEIEVDAVSGSFRISLSGRPLIDSPKTSALAAYSVAKCLIDMDSAIII